MRNAEATRERILEAAMDEFSTFGIAGARVDRIAKTAGCNKNLIYIYFENKETLFTTVLQKHLDQAFEGIPFSFDDIPGFAVNVFDFAMANPKIMRLLMWFTLEQNTVSSLPVRDVAHEHKIDKISKAQANGRISSALPPAFLLTSIMTIATSWAATNPFGPGLNPEAAKSHDALRESVVKAVELLLQAK
ncbi:TetR family transcriptional regulator [Paenibacillus sp. JDR-2]|uniref:TetR family transcriptional regulator n=1 Tax=Paenibacillus sp. (strain JDR-2) TaxID=324057 RepID=UPI000166AD03|nr:TetR family transcriptional regulator [Paenibacillus sp. JDR-2]ACT04802.1 transcriptional regulator, TetR family [Paenibacillus sp. JDR-2]